MRERGACHDDRREAGPRLSSAPLCRARRDSRLTLCQPRAPCRRPSATCAQGKSPSTAAGEFVHEEMDHVREHKHGARSPRQAIAIGLSKARRAGVPLKAPRRGQTSERTRKSAERDEATGQGRRKPRAPSPRRRKATTRALRREGSAAASPRALSRQGRNAAQRRSAADRSGAAKKGAATKGTRGRSQAAKRGAKTRRRSSR